MIRTDHAIKKDLMDELHWDYRVDDSDIEIEVVNGKVTLTGSVLSYSARNTAFTAAWGIDGVQDVANLLRVSLPSGSVGPADAEIKTSVERVLAWNPDVYGAEIDVTVTGGIVRLEGIVDAYWKVWKAEDLVSNLRGVIDVGNHLAVVPTESFVDKDIAKGIEAALKRNTHINAEQITVKVEHGNVTLTGTVPNYLARGQAYNAAALTPGVLQVDNNIVVSKA